MVVVKTCTEEREMRFRSRVTVSRVSGKGGNPATLCRTIAHGEA
jgi:hypothetical protein